jgi:hypothetical protein
MEMSRITMSEENYEYEVEGEVIKMIHDELPAVRWTCAACHEDSCTIFYDPEELEKVVACEFCGAGLLVKRLEGES